MLSDIFSVVRAKAATSMDQPLLSSGGPGGTPAGFFLGAEYLSVENTPPRIVWVPQQELHIGPTRGPNGPPSRTAPRGLFGHEVPVEIHCWGTDGTSSSDPLQPYVNAEQLYIQISQLIHKLLTPRSYIDMGGRWDQAMNFNRAGRVYTGHFGFRYQVPDVTDTFATITEVDMNVGSENPNPAVETEIT